MKKLLYPIAFTLTTFLILYSCSAEEEDTTPPPSIIQTPEPEPAPTQYTLTVTSGEGGTVSTEGGTYDEGTEVTITATPAEGYEFVGWEGNSNNESTITIILNSNLTIQSLFEIKDFVSAAERYSQINETTRYFSLTNSFKRYISLDEAIYLADRILVLKAHPGEVQEVIEVPVPRPRDPEQFMSPEFLATRKRIDELIHPPSDEDEDDKLNMIRLTRVGDEVEP